MILAILLLAFILRLILLNQSLWLDEAIEVLAVKNTQYSALITQYSLGDFHPPLYHLILKFWTGFVGFTEVGARSFSVFTGIATVFVIFLIGKELKSAKLGFFSALFLATAPLHIYYSQEARMYSLVTLFVATLIYFFLKILKSSNLIYWFLFTITLILIFYTDYIPYLILVPLNSYVFWLVLSGAEGQRKNLKARFLINWSASQLIGFLFLIPWLPFLAKQLGVGIQTAQMFPIWGETVGGFDPKAIPVTIAKFIVGRVSLYNKLFYAGLLVLPTIYFALLTIRALFEKEKEKVLIFFWLTIPIIVGFLISIFIPVFSYFRFLFVLPAMYLLLAAGILSFKNLKVQTILVTFVLITNLASQIIFWVNPRFHRENWRGAVSYIETNSGQNSAVVFVNFAQTAPYQYYARSVPFLGPDEWLDKNIQTIWLSRYVQPIFDPAVKVRKQIESVGFVKIEEKDFTGVVIWRYQKVFAQQLN